MADIQLIQQTELPPSRAGIAKPPLSLADQSGQIRLGQIGAAFFGDVHDDLNKSQAANEVATARGQVDTLIESFSTIVADRPNATNEELQQEWKKIASQIDTIPGTLKNPLAVDEMNTFLNRNAGRINQRAQTRMEAIKSKQELTKYQVQRENLIADFQKDELAKLNQEMVESGLLNPEVIKFQQAQDFAVIDEAQREILINNAVGGAFATWESTVTEDNPEGNLNLAFDVVEADPNIPDGEKQEIESELKTRVANRRAENKVQAEIADREAIETISGWINNNELEGITQRINNLPGLTETRQAEEIEKANVHIAAVNSGKLSPYNQGNTELYFKMRQQLNANPKSITQTQIDKLVGKESGLSITMGDALTEIKKPESLLNNKTAERAEEYLRLFKKEDADGWLEIQNDYDNFFSDFTAQNNRPPTNRESEDYLKFLTADPVRKFWTNDLPDEEVRLQLGNLPFEAKQEFVQSVKEGQSTTAWLKEWRKRPKKLTRTVAVHYLQVTGDRQKAINLAKKDGYTE